MQRKFCDELFFLEILSPSYHKNQQNCGFANRSTLDVDTFLIPWGSYMAGYTIVQYINTEFIMRSRAN